MVLEARENASQIIEGLQGKVESAIKAFEGFRNVGPELSAVEKDLEGMGGKIESALASGDKALAADLQKSKSAMEANMKDLQGKVKEHRKIVGGAMIAGGTAMMGVGLGAADILKNAVEGAGDFQELTTQLVTGAGESKDALEQVRQGLLALGPAVGSTPEDLAKGMYMVESSGYHAADGLKVLEASAKGAKIGAADQAVVADALTTVLKDYHLTADQAAGVTGQMTAAVAAGKMHWEDFASSLSKVLPIAAGLNIPFQDVAAAEATMTAHGIDAARASTAVQSGLMQLVEGLKSSDSALQALGVDTDQLKGKLSAGDLEGAMTLISDAFQKSIPASAREGMAAVQDAIKQGIDPTAAIHEMETKAGPEYGQAMANVVKAFGGVRGGALGLTLLPNMDEYRTNIASIGTLSEAAAKQQEAWAETSSDLKVKQEQLSASLKADSDAIGMALIPQVNQLLEKVTPIITAVSNWVQQNPQLAGTILEVVAAGGILMGLLTAVAGVMLVLGVVTAPVALAIVGIAAAIAAAVFVFTHWGEVTQWVGQITQQVWGAVSGFLTSTWDAIQAAASGAWANLRRTIGTGWQDMQAGAVAAWNGITGTLSSTWQGIQDTAASTWQAIQGAAAATWAAITGALAATWQNIQNTARSAWDGFVNILHNALNAVVSGFQWMYAHNYYFSDLVNKIRSSWEDIRVLTTAAWNLITGVLSAAWTWIQKEAGNLASLVAGVWQAISTTASAAWSAITGALTAAWQAISSTAQQIWSAITGAISSVWQALLTTLAGIWDQITAAASATWNAISTAATTAWNGVTGAVSTAWQGVVTATQNMLMPVVNAAGQIWDGIRQAAAQLIADAANWGGELIHNLISGITSGVSNLAGLGDQLKNAVGAALGFHSTGAEQAVSGMANVPAYATGGLVTGPTFALVGESEPEAIIPLSRIASVQGGGTGGVNISVTVTDGAVHVHGGDSEGWGQMVGDTIAAALQAMAESAARVTRPATPLLPGNPYQVIR